MSVSPCPPVAGGSFRDRRRRRFAAALACAALWIPAACAPAASGDAWPELEPRPAEAAPAPGPDTARPTGPTLPAGWREEGAASWYGPNFAGRPTANGEIFDPDRLTAAHRTLPFGTRVHVTNLENGRTVTVRINDRGPFAHGRIIDLSRAAAEAVDLIATGLARVRLEPAGAPEGRRPLRVDDRLSGYDVILPGLPAGTLVVLSNDHGARVLARTVALAPPPRAGADGSALYASTPLVDRLGASATVDVGDGTTEAALP
jgi:rare lipoprotein A